MSWTYFIQAYLKTVEVNLGSCTDLLTGGTKPVPKPIIMGFYFYAVLWHSYWEKFPPKYLWYKQIYEMSFKIAFFFQFTVATIMGPL